MALFFFLQSLYSPAVISKMYLVLNVMAGNTPVLQIIYKSLKTPDLSERKKNGSKLYKSVTE